MARRSLRPIVVLSVLTLALAAASVEAQFGRRLNTRLATPEDADGSFHFCRVVLAATATAAPTAAGMWTGRGPISTCRCGSLS